MITNYQPLYPIILLICLALFIVLLDVFLPDRRPVFLGWIATAGVILAFLMDWNSPSVALWNGIVVYSAYSRAFDTIFLLSLAVVLIGSVAEEGRMRFKGEYYALLIFSTIGLMLVCSAGGLLMLYLGIELASMCLFALVGFAKREQKSAEAALKMFIVGAVASAITLYGISILYGVTGTTQFSQMSTVLSTGYAYNTYALWLGIAFTIAGIAFKIAAAPFHLWVPDVYEGAPSTVTAFLSTASKAGGFAALLEFLLLGLKPLEHQWIPMVLFLAVLSMLFGNLAALVQTNLKRLLAYSGIAQAGFILVAVTGAYGTGTAMSIGAITMYLLLYAFTNIGGFLIAQAINDATGSDDINALCGLHRRSAPLAFGMLIVLFSLGGIPPLAGFIGKLYLFAAGWGGGQHALVLLAALISVVSLYYYLMVALQVYIKDPADNRRMKISSPLMAAISICILMILVIGVYPRPWVAMGEKAAHSMQIRQ
jgi:NADH-quinone oxidoreductase subunit N